MIRKASIALRAIAVSYFKVPLFVRILIAFVLGSLIGLVCCSLLPPDSINPTVAFLTPFGTVLISLLKMVVFPIILFSLIAGAASLPLKQSGRLGLSVIAWYFFTSVFATIFGIGLALFLNPQMKSFSGQTEQIGSGVTASDEYSSNIGGLTEFFPTLFQNPFAALARGDFLPIIIFSIVVGLAARFVLDSSRSSDEERKNVSLAISVCKGCQTISFKIIDWIIEYFPIGVFALSFTNFAISGVELFGPYLRIVLCVVVGTCAMTFLIYPLAIYVFCRENPFRTLSQLKLPILTAFTTRSSAATLTVSMQTANKLGIASSLSSFSLPLGCTVNMDGVCVHLPVFVILASNVFGVPITFHELLVLSISVVFASIGAGGIPGGSVFLLYMILENAGFTPAQVSAIVGLAIGVNPLLDMFETACNVTGDNVCTYIIARRNQLLTPPSILKRSKRDPGSSLDQV